MKKNYLFCTVFATLCLGSVSSFGQGERGTTFSPTLVATSTTNYFFAKPNELTISVDLMGFVQRPGRYEISNTVTLVNLLALAGGPTSDGALNDIRITRFVEVDGKFASTDVRVNLDELSKLSPATLQLSQGDVIQIDRTGWSSFRDGFSILVSAAIITSAIAQVMYATR